MGTKISNLTDSGGALLTDQIPVARSGANRKITVSYIQTLFDAVYAPIALGSLGLVARAELAANATVANGTTARLDYATVTYDRDGAITTGASWAYTAPADGQYRVECFDHYIDKLSASWLADEFIELYLYRGNSFFYTIGAKEIAGTMTRPYLMLPASGVISLTAGQSINVRLGNSTAVSRQVSIGAQIAIYRVR